MGLGALLLLLCLAQAQAQAQESDDYWDEPLTSKQAPYKPPPPAPEAGIRTAARSLLSEFSCAAEPLTRLHRSQINSKMPQRSPSDGAHFRQLTTLWSCLP